MISKFKTKDKQTNKSNFMFNFGTVYYHFI